MFARDALRIAIATGRSGLEFYSRAASLTRDSRGRRVFEKLASEEQRFSDRLLGQLKEFEFQLGERQREQEQRLVQWWDEAEQLARQRVAALLDETLSKKSLTGA